MFLVPNDTVQIYNVSRTQDNTTIVVYWQPLVTTPPVGQIVRYYVEYRDATKGTSNTVYVSSSYTYIVLQNLMNANNYEVMEAWHGMAFNPLVPRYVCKQQSRPHPIQTPLD